MAEELSQSELYRNRVKAVANVLKLAGYNIKYFPDLAIVGVKIDKEYWYVDRPPEIDKYGDVLVDKQIRECCNNCCCIDLQYELKELVILGLHRNSVAVHGNYYTLLEGSNFIGHLRDHTFISYKKAWLRNDLDHYIEHLFNYPTGHMPANIDDLVLTSEFKPAEKHFVDIKNEGFKFVEYINIDKNPSSRFTIFNPAKNIAYVAEGQYVKNRRRGIFKYRSTENKSFAMLFDPQTRQGVLASSSQIVKLKLGDNCKIKCINGLYNDCVVSGDYVTVYEYNGIYFTSDGDGKIIILDARAPHSGLHTKAAKVTN